MSTLSIRGLSKRFGTTQALADLDLDLPEGSRTAVIGPSGSGKTTLLRLIAGFENPGAGEISLDGQRIADAAMGVPAHRRNIGLVMQEGALFPHLTVLQNIRFGVRDRADSTAQALALMDVVELDRSMASRPPHQLSGGQQQRVALARALARQPRLMLLDEPFSALDTGLRDQLRRATADILAKAGVTTLLVTHDREEAMSFADQLVVLRDGRLVQVGRPRELYLTPVDAAAAAFLGPAVILEADLRDGSAHCILGAIPVADPQRALQGRFSILLRPEQLHLAASPAGAWRVRALELVGASAHITLEHATEPSTLVFETAGAGFPPQGSLVSVAVAGRVVALS